MSHKTGTAKYGTTRVLFAKYIHGKTDENHVLFSNYSTICISIYILTITDICKTHYAVLVVALELERDYTITYDGLITS